MPDAPVPARPVPPRPMPSRPPMREPKPPTKEELQKRLDRARKDVEMFKRLVESHTKILVRRTADVGELEKKISGM